MVKPAQSPNAIRAYSVNDPVHGLATAISPSMRITRNTMMPQIAQVMTAPGPAWLMIPLSPTKKPAPMTPPMESMVRWRFFKPVLSVE